LFFHAPIFVENPHSIKPKDVESAYLKIRRAPLRSPSSASYFCYFYWVESLSLEAHSPNSQRSRLFPKFPASRT
jgi:hypothetical protein